MYTENHTSQSTPGAGMDNKTYMGNHACKALEGHDMGNKIAQPGNHVVNSSETAPDEANGIRTAACSKGDENTHTADGSKSQNSKVAEAEANRSKKRPRNVTVEKTFDKLLVRA